MVGPENREEQITARGRGLNVITNQPDTPVVFIQWRHEEPPCCDPISYACDPVTLRVSEHTMIGYN